MQTFEALRMLYFQTSDKLLGNFRIPGQSPEKLSLTHHYLILRIAYS